MGARIANNICGDPALLLGMLYKPSLLEEYSGKTLVIPNMNTYRLFAARNLPKYCKLLSPFSPWETAVSAIWSSSKVISSSLHGLIIADVYGVPNAWLPIPRLKEGSFKFIDYFSSQGRRLCFIANIEENATYLKYWDKGSKVDTCAMLQAFPQF
jgi:pyruvyltransferase